MLVTSQLCRPSFFASSQKYVGVFRFGKVAKCIIRNDFQRVVRPEAVGASRSEFRPVVQTLDRAAGDFPLSLSLAGLLRWVGDRHRLGMRG